jgi:hypothetical protein
VFTDRPFAGNPVAVVQLLANLDRALREVDDAIFSPLTPAERETLNDLLSRAVQRIASDGAPPARDGC